MAKNLGANLTQIDTVAKHRVGTITTQYDPATETEGEFIYLPGVASTLQGSVVVYDTYDGGETVLADADTHLNKGRPVAVAMAAIVADRWGWYQIGGIAAVDVAAAFAAGAAVFLTATAGVADDAAVAGCQILGAVSVSAIDTPSTGLAYVYVNRPFVQGQIT